MTLLTLNKDNNERWSTDLKIVPTIFVHFTHLDSPVVILPLVIPQLSRMKPAWVQSEVYILSTEFFFLGPEWRVITVFRRTPTCKTLGLFSKFLIPFLDGTQLIKCSTDRTTWTEKSVLESPKWYLTLNNEHLPTWSCLPQEGRHSTYINCGGWPILLVVSCRKHYPLEHTPLFLELTCRTSN